MKKSIGASGAGKELPMYSWYAAKFYYKEGDPLCEKAEQAIKNLTGCDCRQSASFHRVNVIDHPPVDKGCEFERVPAFVFHGQKVYEAKGDETVEDFERVISVIIAMSNPSVSSI